MKLGETITITIAGEVIVLRPSLSHALRLVRREGSFPALAKAIMEGSLTAACEIIRHHCHLPFLEARLLPELDVIREPLMAYIMACAGIDPEGKAKTDDGKSDAKPMPFPEYLEGLYRIATGWLGWTPGIALDATPLEIIEAYKGRVEMLQSIFGSPVKEKETKFNFTDDNVKEIFGSRNVVKMKRKKKV